LSAAERETFLKLLATTMADSHSSIPVVAIHSLTQQIQLLTLSFVPRGTIVPIRLPRGPPIAV